MSAILEARPGYRGRISGSSTTAVILIITSLVLCCMTLPGNIPAVATPTQRTGVTGEGGLINGTAAGKGAPPGGGRGLEGTPGKSSGDAPTRKPALAAATYVTDFDAPAYPFTTISFQGLWSREAYDGAHGGQLYTCEDEDAAVEVTVEVPRNGGKLELYSARYWQCGYCSYALVDNATGQVVKSGTVNLYYDNYDSGMPQYGFQVFKAAGLKKGTYTLRVQNLGTPGTDQWPQEILDYFLSQGIDPPPLPHIVNVDYLTLKS